jgi:ubiquinone/menaquinone biosynthesis C-methylase UbiE
VSALGALLSRPLARRLAWAVGERLQCRVQGARLRRRADAFASALVGLRQRSGGDVPPDRLFAGVDDDFWYWLIRESYFRPQAFAGLLPGFPEEAIQVRFTGNAGELMLWQAFGAYRLFRTLAAEHGRPLGAGPVLDFGCGWGRIIRFFLKDVSGNDLYGVDVNADVIEICRRHDRWSRFAVVSPSGPLAFPDASFDLVCAFSVFSHFAEDVHALWLAEIRRVLKPGGLLIATTRPRDFIEQSALDRLRRPFSRHPESIAGMFTDTRRWLTAYDAGQYCYEPLPNMVGWGEACIPKPYVLSQWTASFTILDYVDDPRRCAQNVIVARR